MGVPLPSYDLEGAGDVFRNGENSARASFRKLICKNVDRSDLAACLRHSNNQHDDLEDLIIGADALFSDLLRQWQKDEISETDMIIRFAGWSSAFRRALSQSRKRTKSIPGARALVASLPNERHYVLAPLCSEILASTGYEVTYCVCSSEKELLEKVSLFRAGLVVLSSSPVFAREHLADRMGLLVSKIRQRVSSASKTVLVGRFARSSQEHLSAAGFDHYYETALQLSSIASSTKITN